MASCEKCWRDAYNKHWLNPEKGQVEYYHELLEKRKDNPCTPEQQAGEDADNCPKCGRKTLHQIIRHCTACGYVL